MDFVATIVEVIIAVLLLPLKLVLWPVDILLAQIPGIGAIPSGINSVVAFVGSIPSTMISISGIHPFIWNALFITFVFYIGAAPAIQMLKKIWGWIRP